MKTSFENPHSTAASATALSISIEPRAPSPSSETNLHPDTLLRRKAASAALTSLGFPTAEATLATLASRGNGPIYHRYGRFPLYRWGDLLDWAIGRLGKSAASAAEHRAKVA